LRLRHPRSTLFPYTTLFRSLRARPVRPRLPPRAPRAPLGAEPARGRSQALARVAPPARRAPPPAQQEPQPAPPRRLAQRPRVAPDRKSTRLNSSHVAISYAV